jgi:hypothetical protein
MRLVLVARNLMPPLLLLLILCSFSSSFLATLLFGARARTPPLHPRGGNATLPSSQFFGLHQHKATQLQVNSNKNHRVNTNRGIDPGKPPVNHSARPATWCHMGQIAQAVGQLLAE